MRVATYLTITLFLTLNGTSVDAATLHAFAKAGDYGVDTGNNVAHASGVHAFVGAQVAFIAMKASAEGSPGSYSWLLKTWAEASDPLHETTGPTAWARAEWSDSVTLTGPSAADVTLRYYYSVSGHFDLDVNSSGAATALYDIAGTIPTNVLNNQFVGSMRAHDDSNGGSTRNSTFGGVGFHGNNDFSGSGYFDMVFRMTPLSSGLFSGTASYSIAAVSTASVFNGTAISDFGHTAQLTGIGLLDGTTPESQGYTLTFESGLLSPNLAPSPNPVPEPSSVLLWGFGAIGLAYWGIRVRRS